MSYAIFMDIRNIKIWSIKYPQLEKRANAAETPISFFPFAVLAFGLWILVLLKLCKTPSKNVIVGSNINHLAHKQIETESIEILERALKEMLDLYLLTLFLTLITKHCNKLFMCCFWLVEFNLCCFYAFSTM